MSVVVLVPSPSPLVFQTRRRRAALRMVGLSGNVLWSTGWSRADDKEALDRMAESVDQAARRARAGRAVRQDQP